jgi:hypothetical protein
MPDLADIIHYADDDPLWQTWDGESINLTTHTSQDTVPTQARAAPQDTDDPPIC